MDSSFHHGVVHLVGWTYDEKNGKKTNKNPKLLKLISSRTHPKRAGKRGEKP